MLLCIYGVPSRFGDVINFKLKRQFIKEICKYVTFMMDPVSLFGSQEVRIAKWRGIDYDDTYQKHQKTIFMNQEEDDEWMLWDDIFHLYEKLFSISQTLKPSPIYSVP